MVDYGHQGTPYAPPPITRKYGDGVELAQGETDGVPAWPDPGHSCRMGRELGDPPMVKWPLEVCLPTGYALVSNFSHPLALVRRPTRRWLRRRKAQLPSVRPQLRRRGRRCSCRQDMAVPWVPFVHVCYEAHTFALRDH